MKFSVCVDALFAGKDLYESLTALGSGPVKTVEFWDWTQKDLDRVCALQEKLGLEVLICSVSGRDMTTKDGKEEYLVELKRSLEAAKKLGAPFLVTQVGEDTGEDRAVQQARLVEILQAAIPMLVEFEVTLLVEPLNSVRDHKGYYLTSSKEAFDIIQAVNHPRVKVLFDLYHQQITEGDVTQTALDHLPLIGHFHCAGSFGRKELDQGELDYKAILKTLQQAGYDGFFGLEYFCSEPAMKSITKISSWG